MGGLASLTKRIGWAHIYVCPSRIMQFLSLTLFFNLPGNPVEWSYVSGRIQNHGPWAEVSVTWLVFQGIENDNPADQRAWNFHILHKYQRGMGVSKVNYYPLLFKYREIWPKLNLGKRSKYMIIDYAYVSPSVHYLQYRRCTCSLMYRRAGGTK